MVGADAPQVDQVANGAVQHAAAFFAVFQSRIQYISQVCGNRDLCSHSSFCRPIDLVDFGIRNGVGKDLFQFLGTGKGSFCTGLGVFPVGANHDISAHKFLRIFIDCVRGRIVCAVCRCAC